LVDVPAFFFVVAMVGTVAHAAALSYEEARAALHIVSDSRSGEANVSRSDYTARSADSLWLARPDGECHADIRP
jgi:hypothetical protein